MLIVPEYFGGLASLVKLSNLEIKSVQNLSTKSVLKI